MCAIATEPLRQVSNFSASNEYQELKTRIQDKLLEALNLSILQTLDKPLLRQEIGRLVERILLEEDIPLPLNLGERQHLIKEIQDEILGYGPLEPLLADPSVADILVNTYKQIYVERRGKLEKTEARFKDNSHLMRIIDKIVSAIGRRVDESSPMVDARMPDGSRVNAIIPPLAIDGPMLSVRKFSVDPLELDDMIKLKSLSPGIGQLLEGIVKARLNILISGGTGTGKTTFLNMLSRFIPANERIITIEDSAELQLKQQHVVRLETRPPNIEGKGEIIQRDLVKNSLRMRPDRIIVGEVRGAEALDMLQAMNTGHEGSITTVHANTARDAIMRLETMVAMTSSGINEEGVRRYISSALNVVVHLARLADGSRKLISLQEITGMEGKVITMQEILAFEQTGVGPDGKVKGRFRAHGIAPKFLEKFKAMGVPIGLEFFDTKNIVEV